MKITTYAILFFFIAAALGRIATEYNNLPPETIAVFLFGGPS